MDCAKVELSQPLLTRHGPPARAFGASSSEGSHGSKCEDASDGEAIDVLHGEDGELREGADLAPLAISKHMVLARVAFLFRMLGTASACVTDEGKLVGTLSRLDFCQRAESLVAAGKHAKTVARETRKASV